MTDDFKEPEGDEDELTPDELMREHEACVREYEEDLVKHQEIMDRAASWAGGEGEVFEKAEFTLEQIMLMMMLRQERILLELLVEARKANGQL